MRSIFIVLLIANIGLFAHQKFIVGEKTKAPALAVIKEQGEKLELLSENNMTAIKKTSASVIEDSSPEQDENKREIENDPLCTMVGPYEQLIRAEMLVERLQALSIATTITPVERVEGNVFWVYLAPELSQQDALMKLYELQRKNIESYIITKGELERGISLGQFGEKLEADLRVDEIKKQGYEPLVKEVKKTISETWVTLPSGSAEKINESVWLDILSAENGLERRQNFCISVANQ
jgi:hypothetical protein